jgi:hypothetical protein
MVGLGLRFLQLFLKLGALLDQPRFNPLQVDGVCCVQPVKSALWSAR